LAGTAKRPDALVIVEVAPEPGLGPVPRAGSGAGRRPRVSSTSTMRWLAPRAWSACPIVLRSWATHCPALIDPPAPRGADGGRGAAHADRPSATTPQRPLGARSRSGPRRSVRPLLLPRYYRRV